jgi:hypothetical protein
MSFEKYGAISFTKETKAADFVAYLEQGKVMATKCKDCGAAFFPPRADCADCLSNNVEWIEVSNKKGKLLTYSIVKYGPSGFENDTPYILAMADFPDGLRIFGRLSKEIPQSEIMVGMEVEVVPTKLPEGRLSYELIKI